MKSPTQGDNAPRQPVKVDTDYKLVALKSRRSENADGKQRQIYTALPTGSTISRAYAPVPCIPAPGLALTLAFSELDNKGLDSLQKAAYRLWRLAPDTPGHTERLYAMAQALIYLRRKGAACYDIRAHARHNAAEPHPEKALAELVYQAAIPNRCPVRIIGEEVTGTVVYRIIHQELNDAFPAPWYIVASPHLNRCRAHGADEIEAIGRALLTSARQGESL